MQAHRASENSGSICMASHGFDAQGSPLITVLWGMWEDCSGKWEISNCFPGSFLAMENCKKEKAERCLFNSSRWGYGVRILTVRFALKKLASAAIHLVRQKGCAVLWESDLSVSSWRNSSRTELRLCLKNEMMSTVISLPVSQDEGCSLRSHGKNLQT